MYLFGFSKALPITALSLPLFARFACQRVPRRMPSGLRQMPCWLYPRVDSVEFCHCVHLGFTPLRSGVSVCKVRKASPQRTSSVAALTIYPSVTSDPCNFYVKQAATIATNQITRRPSHHILHLCARAIPVLAAYKRPCMPQCIKPYCNINRVYQHGWSMLFNRGMASSTA